MKRIATIGVALALCAGSVVLSAETASANLPDPESCGHQVLDATSRKAINPATIVYVPGRDVILENCTSKTYIVNVYCANPLNLSTNEVCWTKRVAHNSEVKVSIPITKAYTSARWYSA